MWTQTLRGWLCRNRLAMCGGFVIAAAVLVTYHPALLVGFWTDDFQFTEALGRLSGWDYVAFYFDPRVHTMWYRPLHGVQWWLGYALFGLDPVGYHLIQILLHVANGLLLYGLVAHVSRKWAMALVAALVYSTLPTYSVAVLWLGVSDPLAGLFSLGAIMAWVGYLETKSRLKFGLALAFFVGALLSKETAATLPAILLLADVWLVAKPTPWKSILLRNAPFFLFMPIYALLEFSAVTQGVFPKYSGLELGTRTLAVLFQYMQQLAYPWGVESPAILVWLFVVLAFLAYALVKRIWRVLFLGAAIVLAVVVVSLLPSVLPRYMYVPLMGSAVGFSLLLETLRQWLGSRMRLPLPRLAAVVTVGFVALGGSMATAERATSFSAMARESRLQFRPIYQRHPTFLPGTALYFIAPPFPAYNISGLLYLRYGKNVSVYETIPQSLAEMRDHNAAYVFYSGDQKVLQEQVIAKSVDVRIVPDLPVQFDQPLVIDGFHVVNATVSRGEAIIVFVDWRVVGKITQDYTVFAHLLDTDGKNISSYDSQPNRGTTPTSQWKSGSTITDAIILPIDSDASIGENYRLEVGMYHLPTLQRLSFLNSGGQPIGDAVVLEPFAVTGP